MNNLRNKVQLIGNLGMDPEIKHFDKNRSLAKLSIATTEKYRNASGEMIRQTQWHQLTAFGRMASVAEQFLKKGNAVCVQGKLVHSSYEDKKGVKRYSSEIIVTDIALLNPAIKPKTKA